MTMETPETHPLVALPRIVLEGGINFGRYDTKFRTKSLDVAHHMAQRQYLEINESGGGCVHCVSGALKESFTIVADNVVTHKLPADAVLMVEVSEDLSCVASFVAVRDLQNCRLNYNRGQLTLTEAAPNEWVFDVQEKDLGVVPTAGTATFRVTVDVLQECSDNLYRDTFLCVARAAVQHTRMLLPDTNQEAFERAAMTAVTAQTEKLIALYRHDDHVAAEQIVHQTILACAARHATA